MKKIKILLISDFAYPVKAGTERLVFGIANYFTNKFKMQADILAPNWDNIKEKETANEVNIYRFKTHDISKSKPLKRINDFINAGKKLPKYDIYHGFYTLPPIVSAIALAKIKKSKSVITFFARSQLEKNLKNPLKKIAVLHALKKADRITTYTWLVEKQFKEKYFPEKEITTIQGWAETKFRKDKSRIKGKKRKKNGNWKKKKKRILFVGRMTESKGIYVLLDAFAKIKEKTKAKLVLAGPPYEEKKIKERIKMLGLESRTEFKGFISDSKLNKEYNKCTAVCVPALHEDSFGLSLMEALAIGRPVISTDSVGSPLEEKTGELLVKKNDANGLAQMLLKILTDKEFYKKAAREAKKRAKLFDKKKVMQKYLELYEKLAGEKN